MVVWTNDNVARGHSVLLRLAPGESLDVLGDAKAWGFDHSVRQPRLASGTAAPQSR